MRKKWIVLAVLAGVLITGILSGGCAKSWKAVVITDMERAEIKTQDREGEKKKNKDTAAEDSRDTAAENSRDTATEDSRETTAANSSKAEKKDRKDAEKEAEKQAESTLHMVEKVSAEYRGADGAEGFVLLAEAVPDVIQEIRYYSTYNFVGDRIEGYEEPCALLTKEAADALKMVSDDMMARGFRLKIYDAYRPQQAVDHFVRWAADKEDVRMKPYFYPELDKSVLFSLGYIGTKSGHSRGSTVDLTLLDMKTGKELDMGGSFDYFGERSHPDYQGDLTDEQKNNRRILREAMLNRGFRALDTEWWHFTLNNEPYPNTYFTFPVREDFP